MVQVPPPPKQGKVAIAVGQGGGEDDGMMSPLMCLVTVACEMAEVEKRAPRAMALHRDVVVTSDQEEDVERKRNVRPPPPISNDTSHRGGIIRMSLKKTVAPPVIPSLPPWSTLSTGTRDAVAVGTGPAACALPPLARNTVEEAEDRKRKAAAVEVPEKNRPYKKSKNTAVGWVEKVVRMGGCNPRFVVKKQLSDTDLKTHYSRLPLPVSKDSDPRRGGAEKLVFTFSDSELDQFWSGEGLPVILLDRWGREYHGGRLRLWGSKGWIVLKGGGLWPAAARSMGLRANDTVEVMSFRVGPHKEAAGMLVLVLLPAPEEDPNAGGGGYLRPEVAAK